MEELNRLTEALTKRLFVELEASGRHVHVTRDQAMTLFGHDLREKRPLSQPGQFLAQERVTLVGPKGTLSHVAVLGPARREGQVEISRTDGKTLGLDPPVRLSGDVADTPPIRLEGEKGAVELSRGVLVAQRHLHMTPADAALHHVTDGETIRLKTLTERPLIFEEVAVRVSPDFATYVHLDFDEANACGMKPGDLGLILR